MEKKIMIVDDDPSIRFTVKEGLEGIDESYNVICAESGEECFSFLQNNEIPTLILLDIMMPGMTGWEVINRLRENQVWSNIPVVFLTAKTDDFTKAFGQSISMDFIEKPFDIRSLKHRIEILLERINNDFPGLD